MVYPVLIFLLAPSFFYKSLLCGVFLLGMLSLAMQGYFLNA